MTLAYAVHGEGEPLIILRGLGRTVRHWLGYEKTLAAHFKVITLDLRGIGASKRALGWTCSIWEMADDLVGVLDELGLPAAHVMGVSLGGMVTLATGVKHPDRCLSLTVVNTSIAGQLTMRISPAALAAMATGVLDRKGDAIHAKLVDVLVGKDCPPERKAEIVREYTAIAKADGLYPLAVLKQLAAAARFLPQRKLRQMRVPTMVVYGTHDRFVPNVNSRKLVQYLPDAKLVPLHGAGHEPTLDKGEELAALVRQWTKEVAARSSGARAEG